MSEETSQRPDFIFDAGNLALDFINTRPLSGGRPVDHLTTAAALDDWLAEAGLGEPGGVRSLSVKGRKRLLADAHALRDAIADAVESHIRGRRVADDCLQIINRFMGMRTLGQRLVQDGSTLRRLDSWNNLNPSAVLAPVADAAAHLLAECDMQRVRQCDDDECVLWFVDTTKNGNRRWCSMDRCGSRAKASAYYHRKKRRVR